MMEEPVTIVGAGITGLASALVLSSTHKVTIIARDLPGEVNLDWASPWAGAVFHPQKTSSPLLQEMQRNSFAYYWTLAHSSSHPCSETGVQEYPMTEYFDNQNSDADIWYKTMPSYRTIPRSSLPDGVSLGVQYQTVAMNPTLLLPWLHSQLLAAGVTFIRATVSSLSSARELAPTKIIVNASGLGARELARDEAVKPVRGQTMFVRTDFEECVMREGSEYTYVIPRAGSGGVIMGGIKSDRLDGEVDTELKGDILRRVNRITGNRFGSLDVGSVQDLVGFRPGRKGGLRVEREGDVVHAYGVEGAGYIYSFGVAERVRELIDDPKAKI